MTGEFPTLIALLLDFTGEMAKWAAGGFKVVTEERYKQVSQICDQCEINGVKVWRDDGMYGRCGICGCGVLKRWLSTSYCPALKWDNRAKAVEQTSTKIVVDTRG